MKPAYVSACRVVTWPVGIGRFIVRAIFSSKRRSTTWLMAAALEAARPMPIVPYSRACHGGIPGTARNMPTIAVKTISATTFGLPSS